VIKVEIVADSMAPSGMRLTTFVLTYPRFIHSEFMTHRVFSRNASSSRAIPVKKQIQEVLDNPAIPLAFTKNKAGMQGGEALDGDQHQAALNAWLEARDCAVTMANELSNLEVHKQYANRVLEPFSHITVVVTATAWTNFFALRNHEMAQPEIHELARLMWEAYSSHQPKNLEVGSWHLPFITQDDWQKQFNELCKKYVDPSSVSIQERSEEMIKRSVARCARVSYKNHDGTNTTLEQDLQLYDRLLSSAPLHASPAEHQAMAVGDPNVQSGNFRGWIQFRKTLPNENVAIYSGNPEIEEL
jgi:thymidylate synthase ThyX